MFTDAIELGVACFLAMPEAPDEAIIARLEQERVAPWLAQRIVTWLPVAFGRAMLRDRRWPDEYQYRRAEHRLSDDPVYRAAALRAQRMIRVEAHAIARRSAEVDAINAAARANAAAGRETDPSTGTSALALVSPLSPLEATDGGVPEARALFAQLIEGHGHRVEVGREHPLRAGNVEFDAFPIPRFPAQGPCRPQFDFVVWDNRLATGAVCESFAGIGRNYRESLADAVTKFERGTLHVLIAALLDRSACADQVDWEPLEHASGTFDVCLGAQLHLYSGAVGAPVGTLIDQVYAALAREPLDRSIHAVRLFTARDGDRVVGNEALLDNQSWPAGAALVRDHTWPQRSPMWGTRVFLMLCPR